MKIELVPPEIANPICACGCGELVINPGATWRPGHQMRLDSYKEAQIARQRQGSFRVCPTCQKHVWVRAALQKKWKACSLVCSYPRRNRPKAKRTRHAWNPLLQRLDEYMAEHRLTLPKAMLSEGVSLNAISKWYRVEGSTTSLANLQGLARILGISTEAAIEMAGGLTAEDKLKQKGQELAAQNFGEKGSSRRSEIAAMSGRTWRGRSRSPESVRKSVETRRAAGVWDRLQAAMKEKYGTPEGRALQTLFSRLRDTPQPSRDEYTAWATSVQERLGIPVRTVLRSWRPYLLKKGSVHAGGRTPEEERHRLILDLEAAYPRPKGRLPRGARDAIAQALSAHFQIDPPLTARNIYNDWLPKHSKACTLT